MKGYLVGGKRGVGFGLPNNPMIMVGKGVLQVINISTFCGHQKPDVDLVDRTK